VIPFGTILMPVFAEWRQGLPMGNAGICSCWISAFIPVKSRMRAMLILWDFPRVVQRTMIPTAILEWRY